MLPDSQKIHGRMQNGSEHDAKKKNHSSLYTDKVTDKIGGLGKDRHTDIHRQQEQSVLKKKIINPGGRSRDETSPYRTGARFE